jgi:hypothetical protein
MHPRADDDTLFAISQTPYRATQVTSISHKKKPRPGIVVSKDVWELEDLLRPPSPHERHFGRERVSARVDLSKLLIKAEACGRVDLPMFSQDSQPRDCCLGMPMGLSQSIYCWHVRMIMISMSCEHDLRTMVLTPQPCTTPTAVY